MRDEPTPDDPQQSPDPQPTEGHRVVVVGPDGRMLGEVVAAETDEDDARDVSDLVEQPAKVMRIGSMIKQLLDEVREAPLDEASRARLKEIHARSVRELESGLAPELIEELERLSLPFDENATPSESELRIAQAQLVGWLEGLVHGIQTALFAQQVAARAAFDEMRRRALAGTPEIGPGEDHRGGTPGRSSGPYL